MLLLTGFGLTAVHAQEAVSTSGNTAAGSGGSASYTIGQVSYTSNIGSRGSISQGVQQAFEISIVSGIEEGNNISLTIHAYPNPTTNNLILKTDDLKMKHYRAVLLDINGNMLSEHSITSSETIIPMEQFATQTYFLKVIESPSREVKTFKVIKN